MARGERGRVRHADERVEMWSPPPDRFLETVGGELPDQVCAREEQEELRPPQQQRQPEAQDEPDGAVGPDRRQGLEHGIEPADAVLDDPALSVTVEADQTGSSCLVDSISCCGSNGFPMNPWAPRASASDADSTFPLNMITGIEPIP